MKNINIYLFVIVTLFIALFTFSCKNENVRMSDVEFKNGVLFQKGKDKPFSGCYGVYTKDGVKVWQVCYTDGKIELKKSDTLFSFADIEQRFDNNKKIFYLKKDTVPFTGQFVDSVNKTTVFNFYITNGIVDEKNSTKIYDHDSIKCDKKSKLYSVNGNPVNGKGIKFHPNNLLACQWNYINGMLEGKGMWFFVNGKIQISRQFVNNKMNGLVVEYNDEGQKTLEQNYKDDILNGNEILFANGLPTDTIKYKNGIPDKFKGLFIATGATDFWGLNTYKSVFEFISSTTVNWKYFTGIGGRNAFLKESKTYTYKIENNYLITTGNGETTSFQIVNSNQLQGSTKTYYRQK